jgi:hypothetical protein
MKGQWLIGLILVALVFTSTCAMTHRRTNHSQSRGHQSLQKETGDDSDNETSFSDLRTPNSCIECSKQRGCHASSAITASMGPIDKHQLNHLHLVPASAACMIGSRGQDQELLGQLAGEYAER